MNVQVKTCAEGTAVSELKIGIILGSTRPGRNGKAVADWVLDKAQARIGADYDLIDLADYPLPRMDEPMSRCWANMPASTPRPGPPPSPPTTGMSSSRPST